MILSRSRLALGPCLALVFPVAAQAQERIYVGQLNPSRYHAFSFDGTSLVREDLDPRSSATYVGGGLEAFSFAATDRWFVSASSVVDPFTGVELPRVLPTALVGTAEPVVSADQSFAFLAGSDPTGVPGVSVVDLRPSSATFLEEIRFAALAGDGRVDRAVLSPAGDVLFVALSANSLAPNAQVQAVSATDLPDPGQPIVPLSITTIPAPAPPFPGDGFNGRPVSRLRIFRLGGLDYLFVARRDLSVLRIEGADLAPQGTISSSRIAPPAAGRLLRDIWAADTSQGRRGFVVADVGLDAPSPEELLVLDLDGTIVDDPNGTRVINAVTLTTAGSPEDFETIRGSASGNTLFVLKPGTEVVPRESAEIISVDRASLLLGVPVISRTPLDAGGAFTLAADLIVRNAQAPAPAPTVTSATVEGSAILVNDVPRTVTITGSGLLDARHVFVGLDRLTRSVGGLPSDTSIQFTSSALLPAGREPLLVVDGGGGIGRFDGLVVANSPAFRPAHILYAGASSEARMAVLHAASGSAVTSFFDTGLGPGAGVVSRDGRLLFVSLFRDAAVEVYSTVDDATRGWQANQRIARLHTGGFPQRMVLNAAGTRLYVNTLPGVAVIDVNARPPLLIDADGNPGTTDADVDPALSPGFTKIDLVTPAGAGSNARSVALSDDGQWLYVARNNDPHLMAAFVGGDTVTPSDKTFFSIPSPPPSGSRGRVDGLLVRGSRLYFSSLGDNPGRIRLFDVTGPSIAVAAPSSIPMPAGTAPSVRTISALPDGRFLYVASRTPGTSGETLHVLDPATNTFVAGLSPGSFTDTAAPAPTNDFVYAGSAESDVVTTVDARPGSPTLHRILGATRAGKGAGGAVVNPGLETPAGGGVSVSPGGAGGAMVTFSNVTSPGNTTVTSSNVSSVPLPPGFLVSGVPVFYDVNTTASFTGPVEVCFTYDDTGIANEAALRLLHEEGGGFVDRTTSLDTAANRICGEVTSLSLFVVAERTGASTLCATLGRPGQARLPDLDRFTFRGAAQEEVTLTVAEEEDPGNSGQLVGVAILDTHRRLRVLVASYGALPQSIHTTLPRDGTYEVPVVRLIGSGAFRGAYCATLQSSGNAFSTFEAR